METPAAGGRVVSVSHDEIKADIANMNGRVSTLEAQGASTQRELSEFKKESREHREFTRAKMDEIWDGVTEIKTLLKFLKSLMKVVLAAVSLVGGIIAIMKNWPHS